MASNNDATDVNNNPIKEILLGVILCLIKNLTGRSINLFENSLCRVLLSVSSISFKFFKFPKIS